ncbi:uncharacterized protein LOC141499564 [Macrotis lagotis]|uniref:uncharacterized protein LOC141499564 n=1 Tax=Macrotis lagotis TaxID=92651 RepID=UPI003D696792
MRPRTPARSRLQRLPPRPPDLLPRSRRRAARAGASQTPATVLAGARWGASSDPPDPFSPAALPLPLPRSRARPRSHLGSQAGVAHARAQACPKAAQGQPRERARRLVPPSFRRTQARARAPPPRRMRPAGTRPPRERARNNRLWREIERRAGRRGRRGWAAAGCQVGKAETKGANSLLEMTIAAFPTERASRSAISIDPNRQSACIPSLDPLQLSGPVYWA